MNNIILISELWSFFSKKRKIQLIFLFIFMILASISEVISLSAILPFLAAITSPEYVFKNENLKYFINLIGINSPQQIILPLTFFFITATLLSTLTRLILIWLQTKISFGIGTDLSFEIYKKTLYQPYQVHVARNSSEVIAGISAKTSYVINSAILPFATIVSSVIMIIMITATLFIISSYIALYALLGFGLLYLALILITKKRLSQDGKWISIQQNQVIKNLQEGLGGIRDVLIDGSQESFLNSYKVSILKLNKSLSNITFIGSSPRIGIEGLGMILISFFAYKLSTSKDGLVNAIPILGTLALGAQRILPILQQAFGSWSAMKGGTFALKDTIKLLKQTLPYYALNTNLKKIKFEQEIEFKNITFSYSSDKQILSNINLKIRKGAIVGIVGITGSGKSTFLDILMALQTPTSGEFLVDSELINQNNFREWQLNISHVPQNIFLSDGSILENIAFGVPLDKIDYNKAVDACNYAQLNQTINSLEEGMYTNVGERGVKLSGGQKQRIGLARALYKNSNILILDEATSALDNETENNVMNSVMNLPKNITIIIVAHRLTTLKNCTNIIKIEDGQLFETTTSNELFKL